MIQRWSQIKSDAANPAITPQFRAGRQGCGVADPGRSTSSTTMRAFLIPLTLLALSVSTFAQAESLPTLTLTSNDVVQSSIRVYRMGRTNETRAAAKFSFTDAGAKRLEGFYRAHAVGQEVRYQIGSFERAFKLDDRKHFGREGFWGLPEREAKALEDGLKGRK
jgi:hypothetical protein